MGRAQGGQLQTTQRMGDAQVAIEGGDAHVDRVDDEGDQRDRNRRSDQVRHRQAPRLVELPAFALSVLAHQLRKEGRQSDPTCDAECGREAELEPMVQREHPGERDQAHDECGEGLRSDQALVILCELVGGDAA